MLRKRLLLLTVLSLGLASWFVHPAASSAEERSVRVALPDFTVKLNGNEVDNAHRQYPLLVYKDITYVPMTWYDSRLLGLEASWSQGSGLSITKGSVTSSYVPYRTDRKSSGNLKAEVLSSSIAINGKSINNTEEEYPLLSYNDITYFPMTWRFAHDEFGWDYAWSNEDGLSIRSANPQIATVGLPGDAGDNSVALYKGYYYFAKTVGSTNQVYRSPVGSPSDKELVHEYEYSTSYGPNANLSFLIKDGMLWLFYHMGGATMGHDVYHKLPIDDSASVEHQGYLDFKSTRYGTLIINNGVPPSGNNMYLAREGEGDYGGDGVGDKDTLYGWHIVESGGGWSYGGGGTTTVMLDDVYVMASSDPYSANPRLNRIQKVNIKTNTTTDITHFAVNGFRIAHNKLYYVKEEDSYLYESELDGSNERQLSDNKAAWWFEEIDGQIYYTVAADNGQFYLYKADLSGEDKKVLEEPLQKVTSVNGKLVCEPAEEAQYGLKVLNSSGDLLVAVADQVSNLFAYEDAIVYISASDKSVKRLDLDSLE